MNQQAKNHRKHQPNELTPFSSTFCSVPSEATVRVRRIPGTSSLPRTLLPRIAIRAVQLLTRGIFEGKQSHGARSVSVLANKTAKTSKRKKKRKKKKRTIQRLRSYGRAKPSGACLRTEKKNIKWRKDDLESRP